MLRAALVEHVHIAEGRSSFASGWLKDTSRPTAETIEHARFRFVAHLHVEPQLRPQKIRLRSKLYRRTSGA